MFCFSRRGRSHPHQAFDLARQHYDAGRFAAAEALCHQLLAMYPGNASTLARPLVSDTDALQPCSLDLLHSLFLHWQNSLPR